MSILSIMTSVSPASIGDQAIARVDRQYLDRSEKRAKGRAHSKAPVFESYWRGEPVRLVFVYSS